MKKLISLLLCVGVVFMATAGFADDRDLTNKGFHELDVITEPDATTDYIPVWDPSTNKVKKILATFRGDLIQNGRVNGASTLASSSTALLPSSLPYVVMLKSVGGAGGLDTTPGTTLIDGTPGQVLVLMIKALMTSGTWVVTPVTSTGWAYVTLDTQGDTVSLLYVDDTIGWIITGNSGATITQVNTAD